MKHIPVAFTLMFLLPSCASSPVESEYEPPRQPTALEKQIADASQTFGMNLFRQMSGTEPGKNQFVSPVSVALALGMALNGAEGGTYDSMRAALELNGLTQEEINSSYQSLTALLLGTDPDVTIEIANSVWYRSGFSVERSFIDALTTSYHARVEGLDFGAASASPTINQWVADATHGHITEIVPAQIPPETVLYLINALYYKGTWALEFDPTLTRTMTFTGDDGTKTDTPFMTLSGAVSAAFADDGTTLLELAYGHGHFRMVFVLPPPATGVDAFVSGLTDAAWNSYLGTLAEDEMTVLVPKFRMAYERSLKEDLSAMGMGIAFAPGSADFGRINPIEQLFITEVKHKTFVTVDEKGTEAAAVTSVGIGVTSAPSMVVLDRPFVFAIRDDNTGTVVFIGKMHQPQW